MKILAKMTRLIEGREPKSSIRSKKRTNRAIQWVLWSPRNTLITGAALGAVVATGLVIVLSQYVYGYQMDQFQKEQQAAAAPVATSTGSGQYGLTGITQAPTPTPTATSTKAAPTTTTPAPAKTVVAAPKPVGPEAQAQDTTSKFIAAWLAGPKADSQQAWLDGLAPTASKDLIELFKLTDRSKIPTGTSIESMTSVTVPGTNTAHVSATMKGRGVLGVVLEADQTGAWKVVDIAPEDHE